MNNLILIMVGLSGGIIASAGIVALINVIGTVPRLAAKTKTTKHLHLYESSIIYGGTLGNLIYMYNKLINLPGNIIFYFSLILSSFSGIYIGCIIMALSETLQIMPIYIKRAKLDCGMSIMIISFSLGKLIGSLFYFLTQH